MIKQRLTLWDFMKDHTTLVEDLEIAAKELGKGNHLYPSLVKYAKELAEYDRFRSTEFHSPFDESELWTLEYNKKTFQFHYNNSYKDGGYRQALFSFGWTPVCLIPDCYAADKDFCKVLNSISDRKLSYQDATKSVYSWFSEKNEI